MNKAHAAFGAVPVTEHSGGEVIGNIWPGCARDGLVVRAGLAEF